MGDELRHRAVAVAVVYDATSRRFLLWHNKRWRGYAFPMKHFESGDEPAEVALSALEDRDFPVSLPAASAIPIDQFGECLFSDGVRQYTYYDYHVFGIDPGVKLDPDALDPDLRLFGYEEMLAAPNVTSSTKSIARSLVEDRKVAVAVITRETQRGQEFLLVHNRNYEYFFPATRVKTDAIPAELAAQTVRIDLGYEGDVQVLGQRQVDALQESRRFGPRESRFHFHLCLVDLADVRLEKAGNELEESLDALQSALEARGMATAPYWGWFTEEDMRTRADVSPSIQIVSATVLQLVETVSTSPPTPRAYVPNAIDTSEVDLLPGLLDLTEKLAENAHDIWARQRLSDGWKFGPQRDDDRKEHPCLVPYADLPESEKQYDRGAAMETLKAILALGFRIEKNKS